MENNEKRRVRRLTWEEYGIYLLRFCDMLSFLQEMRARQDIDFKYVFGVERGGLPIAVAVSHYLGIPLLRSLVVDNSRVLIVDDIVDTGETRRKLPVDLHWASIFARKRTEGLVDTYVETTEDWIQFPYELDIERIRQVV